MSAAAATRHLHFDALSIEGGLFPADWLARVAALDAPHQHPDDYAIPRGLNLRDEVGRAWRIAQAHWQEFQAARGQAQHDADGVSRRFVLSLLGQALGHGDLAVGQRRELAGRDYPITLEAQAGRVPVVVGSHGETLDDARPRYGDGNRRRSPFGLLQEYLNASDQCLWGIASNGLVLRLARDNASLTRPAWLEADLERVFTEERYADFSVLWLFVHATRFGRAGQPSTDSPLEAWRNAAREEGTRARDVLRDGVEAALAELGQGFLTHPDNGTLRQALAGGALDPAAYFNELLRLVYRLIFLLTVEERGLLHVPDATAAARALYAEGYGLRRLRERALRPSRHDRHADLWQSLKPVFRGLGRGEPNLGLPALGGLFAAGQCPTLDAAALENRHLLAAVFRLAWLRDGASLARVNWKDMGPEELGSVYESLLELVPEVRDDAREFRFAPTDASSGNARKLSGSYYTPDPLVQQLLDTALEPVIVQRLATRPDAPEQALLGLTVLDPACGSGHFLLGAGRRIAAHLARQRAGGTPTAEQYRHALRDVVTHCLYGVDRNPMALELARIALWLEAFTPDRPLGFLDHHLVCGDALLGLMDLGVVRRGIPDDAFKPLTGDDPDVCKALKARNRAGRRALEAAQAGQGGLDFGARELGRAFAALDAAADDSLEAVAHKAQSLEVLKQRTADDALRLAADLYVGAFLARKTSESQARVPTSAELVHLLLGNGEIDASIAGLAHSTCDEARAMHWHLAFPQVFAQGGFDVVLGNPPWERIKLQEQEFFAARAPAVARASNAAARARAIQLLASATLGSPDRAVYEAFLLAKHEAEAASLFCHDDARYPLTGTGDVNTYALFSETALAVAGRDGRCGLIVPTGIATDDTTKRFFAAISGGGRLVSLHDFRTGPGLFSEIGHQRYKFSLVTLGWADSAELSFFATDVTHLHDRRRYFHLSAADYALLNPNTRTCPVFRSERDAELTKKIYRQVPVLIDETRPEREGNPWGISFLAMFHMSNDSGLFAPPDQDVLPLYEAKMIHQFDHRWATYATVCDADPMVIDFSDEMKADPAFAVTPRYYVPRAEVEARLAARGWTRSWLMGWRDICRSTDERTVIASVVPKVGVGHTMPLWHCADATPSQAAALLANLNSLALDYVARQKIGGTHLTYGYLKQIPVLLPSRYGAGDLALLAQRVLELTYCAPDLEPWARDLGHEGALFRWDPERRALLRAELDAWYARAYGLTRDELRFILDPAEILGDDYPTESFRVLKQNELRQFGEYRTRRLVLESWDRLHENQVG